jgi:hypothetical protein
MECEHDWEEIEWIQYDDYDDLKVPGIKGKISSNMRPGAQHWFHCNYKGFDLNLHPSDEGFGFHINKVCLKCGKKVKAEEEAIECVKKACEKKYKELKRIKDRKKLAKKLWEEGE